jgi:hypothetical protein
MAASTTTLAASSLFMTLLWLQLILTSAGVRAFSTTRRASR